MLNFRLSLKLSLLFFIGCLVTQFDAKIAEATPELVELTVEFTFSEEHRCSRISPEISVSGIPAGTKSFMDKGGHGKIGYRTSKNTKEISIPSVPGHSFELPEGFFILSPHQAPSWDKAGAYMPPCSGGRGNAYYVTVNAVYQSTPEAKEFKLLGQAVLELGKY